MKDGFGFTPEWDTRWAGGFPHRVWLVDAPRDEQIADVEEMRMLDYRGRCEFPRGTAHRYARMLADEVENDEPLSNEDVLELACASLLKEGSFPNGRVNLFVIEALVGTERLGESVLSALEGLGDELIEWSVDVSKQTHQFGLTLVRSSKHEEHRERVRALSDRAHGLWPADSADYRKDGTQNDFGWTFLRYEVIAGGAAAVDRYAKRYDGAIHATQLLFAGDDPDLIRKHVKAMKPGKYVGTEARLVYLAGDDVLEHYLGLWKKFTGDGEHVRMVRTFGEIRDERVATWMLDMVAGSKAKTLATQWFVDHADYARPIVERAKKHPAATKILKKLQK